MRIVMFTPCTQTSAIGRMAKMVVNQLVFDGHHVDVVGTDSVQPDHMQAHNFGVQTLHWTNHPNVESVITQADTLVYQIGDNFTFHEGGLHWLERRRGIVCLHDFFVGNLFCAWGTKDPRRITRVLRHWYNEEIVQTYFDHTKTTNFIANTHQNAPLTEWIASQASAVITHSEWGVHRVLSACPGPVCVVPLAYDTNAALGSSSDMPASHPKQLNVLTIGHVNPNKRVDFVIRALGSDQRLREGSIYTLAGFIQPQMRHDLEKLAGRLKVKLQILGEVSDDELQQLLSSTDVVCCLRNPTLEAASASTIEALLSGKATLVENSGFYAELPDDCVRKIRPEHEEADLTKELLELVADPIKRHSLGQRAAVWARETFTAENYAQQLLEIVPQSLRAGLVCSTFQAFASQLHQWGNSEELLNLPETSNPLRFFEAPSIGS